MKILFAVVFSDACLSSRHFFKFLSARARSLSIVYYLI